MDTLFCSRRIVVSNGQFCPSFKTFTVDFVSATKCFCHKEVIVFNVIETEIFNVIETEKCIYLSLQKQLKMNTRISDCRTIAELRSIERMYTLNEAEQ